MEAGNPVILLLYVDDLFVTGMNGLIADTKRKLAVEFEMKDLGMMHYFLGMEVWQTIDGIFLGQGKYAVEILKRFGMMECKALTTPMESNLKLLSDASSETVDAMYRRMFYSLMFLADPIHSHLVEKHAVRYPKGTIEHDTNQKTNLHGYVDSDW